MHITIEEFRDNNLSNIIKELVNRQDWCLYYGSSDNSNLVKYQLCTGRHYYLLGENGNIISVSDADVDFKDVGLVFFKE